MSTADVWTHSETVAQTLRSSPKLDGLRRVFGPDDQTEQLNPGENALGGLVASLGILGSRPLLIGLYAPALPPLPDAMPGTDYDHMLRMPEFRLLMEDARVVAETLLSAIEHIRSRLPGYPDLPVPSLMPQAPAVEIEGLVGSGMPWPAALRQSGGAPVGLLGASLEGVATDTLAEQVAALAAAVEQTAEWAEFADASASLGDAGRAELETACAEFERGTAPEILDQEAGGYLMSRAEYTRALLVEVADGLSDDADRYLRAFHRIDRVISDVGLVISDRAVHVRPMVVPDDAEVRWRREEEGLVVNARFSGDPFLKPGRLLVYAGEPPVRGGWLATATTMNLDFSASGLKIGLDAFVLPDSDVFLMIAEGAGGDVGA
ncbi:MAG: hypothetical protein M3417_13255 [Actinomycetota bacterium]|nr:hypothetical protein [Actinomycetota bacterium]